MAFHFQSTISLLLKVFWNTVRYECYWFMTRKTFVWINVKCDLPEIGFAHNSRIPKSFYKRSKNLHDCVFVFCYQTPEKMETNALCKIAITKILESMTYRWLRTSAFLDCGERTRGRWGVEPQTIALAHDLMGS